MKGVEILGPLIATDDDESVVELTAPKWRAVLSLLALHVGATVSYGKFYGGLWGEDQPDTAKRLVEGYVWQLRKRVGSDTIETCPGGYRLRVDPEYVDVIRFERLLKQSGDAYAAGKWRECVEIGSRALDLWRDEPLPDLYEDSIEKRSAIARFQGMYETGEDRIFEARLALGEHEALIGDLEAAVVRKPAEERRWEHLMLALYRAGRQRQALEAYQRVSTVLADYGLGSPNQRLRILEAQILAQDPTLLELPTESDHVVEIERPRLPEGNVTFLFSAVDASEQLGARLGPRYAPLLDEHHRVIRLAVANLGGTEVDMVGEQFFAVFGDASRAVQACLEAQQAIAQVDWPDDARLQAQMGVDTCIAHANELGGYDPELVHQAVRICAAAHGSQVLLSAETQNIVRKYLPPEASLVDRGSFMLNGFGEPERLFQLVHPSLESSFPPLRASPAQSHNLPDLRTSFVGRESDLKDIHSLVSGNRMVTIVGTGGVGKTRLAVESAARLVKRFQWGVRLCDLSPIDDDLLVAAAIATAFGLREAKGADALDRVIDLLGSSSALLVLDGCEHVGGATASVVDRLLRGAPGVQVLATSRERLGLPDEKVCLLEPLGIPDSEASLEVVRNSEAVILFETRAGAAQPGFVVTESSAPAVIAICRDLGGLPLAIEIVAAQMAALSPAVIAERLESGLPVAPRVPSDGTERHRSLESTIDWSYQLLDEPARTLLRFLSVFANGFTVDAARSISDAGDPVVVLTQLVEKSLVIWDHDAARYRLLEPIRTFARARLDDAGDGDLAGARHLAWCAALAASLKSGHSPKESHELFDRELDNFRVALAWAAQHATAQRAALAEAVEGPVAGLEEALPAVPIEEAVPPAWEWEAVAEADRDHFERLEAPGVEFPSDPPQRRFPLTEAVVRIGRRHKSGGPVPEIDLSSTPVDEAISHEHALLIRQSDGTWAVVDDKSTNGVFVNDSIERIPQGKLLEVSGGDRVHIGAWTTITIRRVEPIST